MRFTEAISKVIDANPNYGTRLQQAEKLADKWQRLGLMEGLDAPKDSLLRTNVAIMLQNQAKQILRQANYTSTTQFHEQWVGIAMPLVRRFMHKLAAKDFVTVQAMSQPTGLVFFIDHQFGTDRKGFKKGDSIYGTEMKGIRGEFDYVMDTNLAAGLYGGGKWGYSLNELVTSSAIEGVGQLTGSQVTAKYYQNDSRFEEDHFVNGTMSKKVKVISVALPKGADKNGYDSFYLTNEAEKNSKNYIANLYRQYTRLDGDNIRFVVETHTTESYSAETTSLYYHAQPQTYDRGDFQYQTEQQEHALQTVDIGIPQIQFKLSQKPIVPQTRKMKATWTQQLIDDLNALLAIDGEQQISNQLTDQITLETDLQIISMIGKGAVMSGNEGYFSVVPGNELDGKVTDGVAKFKNNGNYAIQDKPGWFRNIAIPMQKVSNMIHQKTGKGGANFAIVSPALATVLQTIQGFSINTDGTQEWMEGGFTNIGNFKSRYKIYKNPYSVADNMMIMGYRGTGFLDFGAAYCPYIPLIMLPNIMQPTNLTPTKGVYTRYAKTMLRRDYYGVVYVHGLQTV